MAWTTGVTTGATMATQFNNLESAFAALDADFDALLLGFSESVDDRVASLLIAGANVTLTYDDIAGTLTIAATSGGGGGGFFSPIQGWLV